MATIGIDLGSCKCIMASIGRGVIDVLINDISERSTPSLVGFTCNERLLGDPASTQFKSNFRNTCRNMKMCLGRTFRGCAEEEQQFSYVPIVEAEEGTPGYEVMYRDERRVMNVVSVVAAMLGGLKDVAERALQKAVYEVVIGVPSWYADANIRALQDAVQMAGLTCLRFFPEHTASALDYGIFRASQFHPTTHHRVLFVDVGYTSTTAFIADFIQSKLEVVHVECHKHIGGRNFDATMSDILARSINKQTKGHDVRNSDRAAMKIEDQAVKTKKVLSANQETVVTLEGIYEEEDYTVHVTRQMFADECKPYQDDITAIIQRALQKNGGAAIHSFELVGGCTRIPWVQECIRAALSVEFGEEILLSRTLNQDECVAKGCALQAAMLCPRYKVKDFSVVDCVVHPLTLSWEPTASRIHTKRLKGTEIDSEMSGHVQQEICTQTIVSRGDPYPKTSWITFQPQPTLEFCVSYSDVQNLPSSTPSSLGSYRLTLPPKSNPAAKLKVKVEVNLNRLCCVDAYLVEKETYEEVIKEKRLIVPVETPPNNQSAGDEAGSSKSPPSPKGEPQDDEKPKTAPEAARPEATVPKKTYEYVDVKRIKTRNNHVAVNRSVNLLAGCVSQKTLQALAEAEISMSAEDRQFRERKERLNDLESYVYNTRDKIQHSLLGEFLQPEERRSFVQNLDATSQWIYDEGETAQKSLVVQKLQDLQAIGDRASYLQNEAEFRKQTAAQFLGELRRIRTTANSLSHIDPPKKDEILDKCQAHEIWLNDQLAIQASLPLYVNVAISSQQILQKIQDFSKEAAEVLVAPQQPPVQPPPADANEVPPAATA